MWALELELPRGQVTQASKRAAGTCEVGAWGARGPR